MKAMPQAIDAESHTAAAPPDVAAELRHTTEQVGALIPDCLGLSVAWIDHGVSFTLASSSRDVALLDALHYLDSGPHELAVARRQGVATTTSDLWDRRDWQLLARASTAAGVQSTVCLPLREHGRVIGSVNLYGTRVDTFDHQHEQLARLLSDAAPWARRDAAECLDTRHAGERTPQSLRAQGAINLAIGMLATRRDVDVLTAQEELEDAAARAGTAVHDLAEAILRLRH